MTATTTYKHGELYVFTDGQDEHNIWGIFEGTDARGNILLETATDDFDTFRLHVTLPIQYDQSREASRSELRDFAFNMGYRHI